MAERALAHVEIINDIQPIPNADKIVVASVLGWKVVIRKDEFQIGDKIIYIEIDSKVPETPYFEFLRDRKFKVKTIKLRGQLSQGLIAPLSILGRDAAIGEDVTKELGITYYVAEDNARKAPSVDKYKVMAQRHSNLFKRPLFRWMMRRTWGRKLLFIFFGKKKDKKNAWPQWVKKTDEERVQNMPWILDDKSEWIATEKIDGSSATYTMKRNHFGKNQFFICSRNVVFDKPDKPCFYDTNIYVEIAEKYNIEEVLNQLLKTHSNWKWVTIQGEIFGGKVQLRDYSTKVHDFRAFNFITSEDGRFNSTIGKMILKDYNIPWVPIVDTNFIMPDTVDELLEIAAGPSKIDGFPREGLVFRSKDGTKSFKAVDNGFLMKYHA